LEAVNHGLSEAAQKVAELGGGDGFEHLHLVDLKTGGLSYYETNNEPSSVGGRNLWNFIKNNSGSKFAFVHNHGLDSSFSEPDMRHCLRYLTYLSWWQAQYICQYDEEEKLAATKTFQEIFAKSFSK